MWCTSVSGCTYLDAIMHIYIDASISVWVCMCKGIAHVGASLFVWFGVVVFYGISTLMAY